MSTEGTTPAGTPETLEASRPAPAPAGSVVVGHDGSAFADHALRTAFGLADELHVPVVIVRAWSIDTAPRPAQWQFGYVSSFNEYSEAVRAALIEDTAALAGLLLGSVSDQCTRLSVCPVLVTRKPSTR